MAGFQCPYCSHVMSLSSETMSQIYPSFNKTNGYINTSNGREYYNSCLEVTFYNCPNCGEYTISSKGMGTRVKNVNVQIKPLSSAKQFPNFIPFAIRQDYEEACVILNLSPKASATLSRRCLQGMIRDFWDIKLKSLNQEITALKDKIAPDLWDAIDSLRQLGNIGAHMEKDTDIIVDIDPDEAQSLIKLIELLMKEWYINREERKKLFSDILSSNSDKQELRKNGTQ